jgi:hypothetical protein
LEKISRSNSESRVKLSSLDEPFPKKEALMIPQDLAYAYARSPPPGI